MPEPTAGAKLTLLESSYALKYSLGSRVTASAQFGSGWFGPLAPFQPATPPEVKGRQYDYPVAFNINYQPRATEVLRPSFETLRALAKNCDLVAMAISTRQDQVDGLDWTIRKRKKPGQIATPKPGGDPRIEAITEFLHKPDGQDDWATWIRKLVYELLTTDAVTIYRWPNRGGGLFALELVDGATIKPLIDDAGRIPRVPEPAFQQVLKGVPGPLYTTDEMLYAPRNKQVNGVYGYPPVEQVLMTVNIALLRAVHQIRYYKDGNMPDAVIGMPEAFTSNDIKDFQAWWDSLHSGDLAARRMGRFVPGGTKVYETRQPPLKDMYDEWLARVICYAFSISPEPFVAQMNRATSESAHDRALEEGLGPIQVWIKRLIDRIIRENFNSSDLEFAWDEERDIDPKVQGEIDVALAGAGIMSIDEVRETRGLPAAGGMAARPMVKTATGYVSVVDEPEPPPAPIMMHPGDPNAPPQPPGKTPPGKTAPPKPGAKTKAALEKALLNGWNQPLGKRAKPKTRRLAPISETRAFPSLATTHLKSMWAKALQNARVATLEHVRRELKDLAKADDANTKRGRKASAKIDFGFDVIKDATEEVLQSVAADAGKAALAQLGVLDQSDLVDQVFDRAVNYASDSIGDLISGIDDTTRDVVRGVISRGLDDNMSLDDIITELSESTTFSAERAELIARTEIRSANSMGALEGYKVARDEAGVQTKKLWSTAGDDDVDEDICAANEEEGPIDLDDAFQSGDMAPPGHPRCRCALVPIVEEPSDEDQPQQET